MPIVAGRYITYTVQPNDTLYAIANRFGSNVPGISQINGIYPPFYEAGMIYPGQRLIVPVLADTNDQTSQVLYFVQPGDSLYSIARTFLTSVNDIMNVNPQITDPNAIQANQLIEIPIQVFVVSTGDSLYAISQQLGVSMQVITQLNQNRPAFSPSFLAPGYGLFVP